MKVIRGQVRLGPAKDVLGSGKCPAIRLRVVLVVVMGMVAFHLVGARAVAQAVTLIPSLTKIAGTDSSGTVLFNLDYGTATSVALDTPNFVAFDELGDQYFSDTGSNCVRMIDTGGKVSTIVGLIQGTGRGDTCNAATNPTPTAGQGLLHPSGIALAPNGDLYLADSGHNCIRRLPDQLTGTANLVTVAGDCLATALLSPTPAPSGLALDSNGNLYIAVQDAADGIYQVLMHPVNTAATSVCVMAGGVSALAPQTCPAVTNNTITLNRPSGLAINGQGSLMLADTGNRCIREIADMTTIQTVVGQCTNDNSGPASFSLTAPYGLQFDQSQALLISDGNQVLRHLLGSSTRTLLAGLPNNAAGPYAINQDGAGGPSDPLNTPQGLAIDSYGNITVADSANHIVRALHPDTEFSATPVNSSSASQPITFAINQNVKLSVAVGTDYAITSNTCSGSLGSAGAGNPPTTCQVFVTFHPTRPGQRNAPLMLSDSISNSQIFIGLQGDATGPQLQFFPGVVNTKAGGLANPVDLAVDIDGNTYVLEKNTGGATADIKELVAASHTIRTAVAAGSGIGADPVALTRDSGGDLFVVDQAGGAVARFAADGSVNANYLTGLTMPSALYVDGFDNLYIAQAGSAHNILEVYASGGQRIIAGSGATLNPNGDAAASAQFVSPSGISLDPNGAIYVADAGAHRVYAIDTSGIIHFVAGNGTTTTTDPATPLGIGLVGPTTAAVDAAGDLYIADPAANIVYVVFSTGSQSFKLAPILGNGTAASTGDGGPSSAAAVNNPLSLAIDGSGNSYVIDGGSSSVREVSYPSPIIDFGTVQVGKTSASKTTTIWNSGTSLLSETSALTINNLNFFVDPSTSVTTCGTSLVAGGTCNLGFYFQPVDHGAQIGTASLTNNSYLNPAMVTLLGQTPLPTAPVFNLPPETEVYLESFLQMVTFGASAQVPTGTITFSTGTQVLCTYTGNMSATTTCPAPSSGLSVGSYPVAFSYSGDANFAPLTATTTLTVTPQPTTTTITTSATPVSAGSSLTLTSTVNSALGPVTIGNVTFTDSDSALGMGTLNASGMATLSTSALATGSHGITAAYPGTLNFSPSSATLIQVITLPQGSFTLAVTPRAQFLRGAGSVTWQVAVTSVGGFAGPIALTCSGLPSDAGCTFAQPTATLTAGGVASTTMTTTATLNDAALAEPLRGTNRRATSLDWRFSSAYLLPLEMSGTALLWGGLRRKKARPRHRLWLIAALALLTLALSGCNCFNSSYKTYPITVTGTSTLGGPSPQSATVQLSVGSN